MDVGKAFSYVFDDEQWLTSILIAGLLALVPILGWIAILGYMLEAARNVAMGSPRPLPKWDNFGEKLSLGFNAFLITLGWSLPVLLLMVPFMCIPLFAMAGGEDAAAAAALGTVFCIMPIVIVLGIALQVPMLAGLARYLQTGSLGSAFKVGEIIAMVRADLGGWVVLWLLYLLCSIVASLGSVVIIGFIFTLPYSQAVFGHLLGQKLQQLGRPAGYDVTYNPPPAI